MFYKFEYKVERFDEELEKIVIKDKVEILEFIVTGKTFLEYKNKTGKEFLEVFSNVAEGSIPIQELTEFVAVCHRRKGKQNEDTYNYILEHEKGMELILSQDFLEKLISNIVSDKFVTGSASGGATKGK